MRIQTRGNKVKDEMPKGRKRLTYDTMDRVKYPVNKEPQINQSTSHGGGHHLILAITLFKVFLISFHLSLYIYIYIYMHMSICMYVRI